ncbi:MAG: cytochrome c-type biogenesis protein [Azospirillaceae bacterium]
MRCLRTALAALFLLGAGTALALEPEERLADPVLEARALELYAELRCVVCQNNSLLDSPSQIASDMRAVVRDRLVAGDSDAEARAFLVDRYGDYVLMEPPFNPSTLVLWLAPIVVLAGAGGLIAWRVARRPARTEPDPLTPEERAAVEELLARQRRDEPREDGGGR